MVFFDTLKIMFLKKQCSFLFVSLSIQFNPAVSSYLRKFRTIENVLNMINWQTWYPFY
jgi:hypothetical protein